MPADCDEILRQLIESTCTTLKEFDDWIAINDVDSNQDRFVAGLRLQYLAREYYATQASYNAGVSYGVPVVGVQPAAVSMHNGTPPTPSVHYPPSSNAPWIGTRGQQQQTQQQHYHTHFPTINQAHVTQHWGGSRGEQQRCQRAWRAAVPMPVHPTATVTTQPFVQQQSQTIPPTGTASHAPTQPQVAATAQPSIVQSTNPQQQQARNVSPAATPVACASTSRNATVGQQGYVTPRTISEQQLDRPQPVGRLQPTPSDNFRRDNRYNKRPYRSYPGPDRHTRTRQSQTGYGQASQRGTKPNTQSKQRRSTAANNATASTPQLNDVTQNVSPL